MPERQDLPYGGAIIGFESMEELQAYMGQREEEAIAGVVPEQEQIIWGSYCVRFVPDLVVWGEIWSEQRYLDDILKEGQEPDIELLEELRITRHSYASGYRYGKWYSIVEPSGEYGSAHLVTLWPITQADFVRALKNDWKPWDEFMLRMKAEMAEVRERIARKEREDEG